jgi:hypothetical protein
MHMIWSFLCFDIIMFHRVFCKKLQSDEADFLLFTEKDTNSCVDITSTKDFEYITVNSNTRTSSEEGFFVFLSLSPNVLGHIDMTSDILHGCWIFLILYSYGCRFM